MHGNGVHDVLEMFGSLGSALIDCLRQTANNNNNNNNNNHCYILKLNEIVDTDEHCPIISFPLRTHQNISPAHCLSTILHMHTIKLY